MGLSVVKIEEHTQAIRKICCGALLEGFICLCSKMASEERKKGLVEMRDKNVENEEKKQRVSA